MLQSFSLDYANGIDPKNLIISDAFGLNVSLHSIADTATPTGGTIPYAIMDENFITQPVKIIAIDYSVVTDPTSQFANEIKMLFGEVDASLGSRDLSPELVAAQSHSNSANARTLDLRKNPIELSVFSTLMVNVDANETIKLVFHPAGSDITF